MGYQIGDERTRVDCAGCCRVRHLVRASARVMSPLNRLCSRCMRWQLDRRYCDPPRDRGMSSSTSARIGCGTQPAHPLPLHLGPCTPGDMVRLRSTGSPQSAHVDSSRLTRLTSCRRLCPLACGWRRLSCISRSRASPRSNPWMRMVSPIVCRIRGIRGRVQRGGGCMRSERQSSASTISAY